jgi:3-hydroxyacyl-CoA dehydrogenase
MNYTERLQNVSVLGAAGKMGSGILLLTALEMADLSLKPENKGKKFVINAIDLSYDHLMGLLDYVRVQTLKAAEKKTVQLRALYADRSDLIENSEIIDEYVLHVLRLIRPSTDMKATYESTLIFEAVNESKSLKVKLFTEIDKNNPSKPWFLTNTSSVPIHEIDTEASLGGRIMGFHFYNPPAIQKLVEIIAPKTALPEVKEFALQYAKNLRKVVVHSNDFAGFIGNGHFMRDALHAIATVEELNKKYSFVQSVLMVNKVAQDYLVRPMGIFQLIDYVGIDVMQFILNVMNPHNPSENLHSKLIDQMLELGIKGGQHSDGSQKDGFLRYAKGRITEVYDLTTHAYVSVDSIQVSVDQALGQLPDNAVAWKSAIKDSAKDQKLRAFFNEMSNSTELGSKLALAYGKKSNSIGKKLVSDGVAISDSDVNTVMMTGFFHAYGPVNDFFN